MLKRTEAIQIGEVLRQAIEESDMQSRLDEVRAAAAWPAVGGSFIASQTGKPFVEKGVLTVSCRSASLRQELTMQRSVLLRMLNEAAKAPVLRDIRFIS